MSPKTDPSSRVRSLFSEPNRPVPFLQKLFYIVYQYICRYYNSKLLNKLNSLREVKYKTTLITTHIRIQIINIHMALDAKLPISYSQFFSKCFQSNSQTQLINLPYPLRVTWLHSLKYNLNTEFVFWVNFTTLVLIIMVMEILLIDFREPINK